MASRYVAAGAAAIALVVAGCGSSSSSKTASAAATTASVTSTASSVTSTGQAGGGGAKFTSALLAPALSFVNGKAGAATSSEKPFTIGLITPEEGPILEPELRKAAEAAADLINDHLGGIGGHPVQISACPAGASEQQGQQCGEQFLNNSAVQATIEGPISLGSESYHQVLDGKVPIFETNPSTPLDETGAGSFALYAGIPGGAPNIASYVVKYLKPKTVSMIYINDNPNATSDATLLIKDLKAAGVTVHQAGFPQTATSMLAPLVAAGAQHADVVIPLAVGPAACAALPQEIKQLNITAPIVTYGFCVTDATKRALGDWPKFTYLFYTPNPYGDNASALGNAEVATYHAAMTAYAAAGTETSGFSPAVFSSVLTWAKLANQVGFAKATRSGLIAAAKSFTGPGFLGPPHYAFGSNPAAPAIGSLQTKFFTYKGNGDWIDATPGWVTPS